jgi:hypothetical protein
MLARLSVTSQRDNGGPVTPRADPPFVPLKDTLATMITIGSKN